MTDAVQRLCGHAEGVRLALVTGASGGIGAALARGLARQGYDLAVTGRRATALSRLAEECRTRFGVQVLPITADLSYLDAAKDIIDRIADDGRRVDVLVTAAGYFHPADFADVPGAERSRFLRVMLHAPCELTGLVLPGMKEAGAGQILHVASLMGLLPGPPGHGLYGASKAFLIHFTQALNLEMRGHGIKVCALCPGLTDTGFFDGNGTREAYRSHTPAAFWQSADVVARSGLRAVQEGRAICVPGVFNKALAAFVRYAPSSWSTEIVRRQALRFAAS